MHCISSYPNKDESSYLSNITLLKRKLDCIVGISDHTNDIKIPIYGTILGAKIIEKHFTLNRKFKGPDFSPINLPSKITLIPSSILPHPQAPFELWIPTANPHWRLNFPLAGKPRRTTVSGCYFSEHYQPNPAPKGRKPYFSEPRGLLIGRPAEIPPYREGSETFYMLV